jgi:hypothetical protein
MKELDDSLERYLNEEVTMDEKDLDKVINY